MQPVKRCTYDDCCQLLASNYSSLLRSSTTTRSAITINAPDGGIRATDFSTDGRGQTETHCAQATGSDEAIRFIIIVIMSSPHLVLAYLCGYNNVVFCNFAYLLYDILRVDFAFIFDR